MLGGVVIHKELSKAIHVQCRVYWFTLSANPISGTEHESPFFMGDQMHYYKFNIKDWTRDTAHLSLAEEGVYRRLLDHYYETEKPIPEETQSVIRRLRLAGHEEALGMVLSEFFVLESDGYRHKRCDDEIAKYHAKADANRKNGSRGGRPEKPKENPDGSQKKPTDNLNHKPLTNNQDKKPLSSDDDGHKFRFAEIKDAYNRICSPTLPACLAENETRKRQARKMVDLEFNGKKPFREHGIAMWESYFRDCLTNKHWCGENDRGWRADFDFVTNTKNAIKLLERICG